VPVPFDSVPMASHAAEIVLQLPEIPWFGGRRRDDIARAKEEFCRGSTTSTNASSRKSGASVARAARPRWMTWGLDIMSPLRKALRP